VRASRVIFMAEPPWVVRLRCLLQIREVERRGSAPGSGCLPLPGGAGWRHEAHPSPPRHRIRRLVFRRPAWSGEAGGGAGARRVGAPELLRLCPPRRKGQLRPRRRSAVSSRPPVDPNEWTRVEGDARSAIRAAESACTSTSPDLIRALSLMRESLNDFASAAAARGGDRRRSAAGADLRPPEPGTGALTFWRRLKSCRRERSGRAGP